MNQITVRGIAPELEREIRRKRRNKPAGASLAELAGGWSENEARKFEDSVRVFEEIDEAMWK